MGLRAWVLARLAGGAADADRSRYLSKDDEITLRGLLYRDHLSALEAADVLGRHVSTVYRFMEREEQRRSRAEETERQRDPIGYERRKAQMEALRDPRVQSRIREQAMQDMLDPLGGGSTLPPGIAGSIAGVAREVLPHVGSVLEMVKEVNKMAAYTPDQKDEIIQHQAARIEELETGHAPDARQIATAPDAPPPAQSQQSQQRPAEQPPQPPPLPDDPSVADCLWRWLQMAPVDAAAEAREVLARKPKLNKHVAPLLKKSVPELFKHPLLPVVVPAELIAALRTERGVAWLTEFRTAFISPAPAARAADAEHVTTTSSGA